MAQKLTKKITKPVKPVKSVKKTTSQSGNYISAIGRRRNAIARVRLYEGKQEMTVNHKPISDYWRHELQKVSYLRPFTVTDTLSKYTVSALVSGGGVKGQLNAFAHGVAQALNKSNPSLHVVLKKAGLLSRDPRMKETRKVGRAGKARLRKQSPKR